MIGGIFIARKTTFRTLQELVDHYSKDADGCVSTWESHAFKWKSLWRRTFSQYPGSMGNWQNLTQVYEKTCHGQFGEVWEVSGTIPLQSPSQTLKPGTMDPKDFSRSTNHEELVTQTDPIVRGVHVGGTHLHYHRTNEDVRCSST